jgi:hypothetical protein
VQTLLLLNAAAAAAAAAALLACLLLLLLLLPPPPLLLPVGAATTAAAAAGWCYCCCCCCCWLVLLLLLLNAEIPEGQMPLPKTAPVEVSPHFRLSVNSSCSESFANYCHAGSICFASIQPHTASVPAQCTRSFLLSALSPTWSHFSA